MKTTIQKAGVILFCVITVALTFASYLLPLPREVLPLLIVFLPTLVGLTLTLLEGRSVGAYFAQINPSRLSWKWAGIALLIGLALRIGVMLVGAVFGVPGSLQPGAFIPFLLMVFVFAAGEEIGWRGYALPKLLETQSPFSASLILGVPWAVLHLTLYLPGMMLDGLPPVPALISIAAFSVLITWLWISARPGGVLAATLVHGSQNMFVFLNNGIDPATSNWLMAGVYIGAALIVCILAREWFFTTGKAPTERVEPSIQPTV